MDNFLIKAWKILKNTLLLVLITSAVILIIALIGKFKFSRGLLYTSIFFMAIGLGAIFGSLKATSPRTLQNKGILVKDIHPGTGEDIKLSKSSHDFLISMEIAGIIIMCIGFIFDYFGL